MVSFYKRYITSDGALLDGTKNGAPDGASEAIYFTPEFFNSLTSVFSFKIIIGHSHRKMRVNPKVVMCIKSNMETENFLGQVLISATVQPVIKLGEIIATLFTYC